MPSVEVPTEHDPRQWFVDHFERAADEIIDFIASDGIVLEDTTIADIGSGDGLIDLGVALKARPAKLVGYDIRCTDAEILRRAMTAAKVEEPLPHADHLAFVQSEPDHVPAPNDTFDVVFSWSVFEHVDQPIIMLQEIRRILKPDGVLFLQIWPFFGSQHGGHLWQSVDDSFAHLIRSPFELEDELKGKRGTDPSRSADDEFRSLNRITVEGLQRALLAARLRIAKVQLLAETTHIPPALSALRLCDLGISGIKLLASPF
jgi:SAM-dependent methyltransferase